MRNYITRVKEAFREDSPYKQLLLAILITGLSYGLYKGMIDNYLAEVVGMGEMGKGVTEFFRELPGILLVFILAAFYMLSAETLFKIGAVFLLVGMGMHAILPPHKVLITLAICVYSLGDHIQLGMKNTMALEYSKPEHG
ncbi:MAG: MFS transporter, partial [Firmicutes bacterium]|nr:MFS transporter [Bacillota bacterium]